MATAEEVLARVVAQHVGSAVGSELGQAIDGLLLVIAALTAQPGFDRPQFQAALQKLLAACPADQPTMRHVLECALADQS